LVSKAYSLKGKWEAGMDKALESLISQYSISEPGDYENSLKEIKNSRSRLKWTSIHPAVPNMMSRPF